MRLFFAFCVLMMITANNLYAALPDIDAAMMNKNYVQARDLASEFLKKSNDPALLTEARYDFGLALLRLGQYTAARNAFQIVMDAKPSQDIYDKSALGITEEYYTSGFYQDSLDTVEQLLKHSPNSSFLSLIYLKIAGDDLKLAKWEDAKQYLNKVINEFPSSAEAPVAKELLEEKHYFTVQVGSFLDKDRALELIKDLKAGGQESYIVEIKAADGEKLYRVRVGKMNSLKEAEDAEKQIIKLGFPALIYP